VVSGWEAVIVVETPLQDLCSVPDWPSSLPGFWLATIKLIKEQEKCHVWGRWGTSEERQRRNLTEREFDVGGRWIVRKGVRGREREEMGSNKCGLLYKRTQPKDG
jgi:hypothetical protein